MFHLVLHMEEQLARWGPVKDVWMFMMEDFFGYKMTTIKSRSHFVSSIMRQDRAMQVLTMAKDLIQVTHAGGTCSVRLLGSECVSVCYSVLRRLTPC